MEKRVLYRGVEMRMERGRYYGHYILSAWYKGKTIKASTYDSEIFDWLDDDEVPRKHEEAKAMAFELIRRRYQEIIEDEEKEEAWQDACGYLHFKLLPED